MKGLISYSSHTGNTEKLAQVLYDTLKDCGDFTLCRVQDIKDVQGYDVILHGLWVNRTDLDKDSKKFLASIPDHQRVGLFGTSGGEHASPYARRLMESLEQAVQRFDHIGTKLTYGKIDPAMAGKVDGILGVLVPQKVKTHILEMVEKSREATPQERQEVADFFKNQLFPSTPNALEE